MERAKKLDHNKLAYSAGQQTPSRVRFLVAGMLCAAAIIAYMQRNSIGVAETRIRQDLHLSMEDMSWVMSIFFFSYALLQVPTGWITNVWGVRRSLTLFVVVFSGLAGVFALARGGAAIFAARVGMGLGQAGLFPATVQAISNWFPQSRRGLITGLLAGSMSVGGALGAMLMGVFLHHSGWRPAYLLFAGMGVVWAGVFYWFYRNQPREHPSSNEAEAQLVDAENAAEEKPSPGRQTPNQQAPAPAKTLRKEEYSIRDRVIAVAALCSQQVCRGAAQIFFSSWFATYLRQTRGVEDLEVGLLNSLPLWAIVVGCPAGGITADYVFKRTGSLRWSRQGVAAVSMVACSLLVFASQPIDNAWLAVCVISAGSFFAAFGGPCAYTAAIEIGGRRTALVFGLMNMCGNLGAFGFAKLVPWILAADPNRPDSGNWDLVLYVFVGLYFLAAFFWLFANTNVSLDAPLNQKSPEKNGLPDHE